MKTFVVAAALLATLPLSTTAFAQEEEGWVHAVALDGTPKYEAGFEMFDYVNPDAPKGGTVRLSALGGFDTFNAHDAQFR